MQIPFIKSKLLTIIILFVSLDVFSQSNLKSAYVITLEGDTVHGYINAKNWNMNPTVVNFKQSTDEEGVYYGPHDIKLFSMEGDIYEGGYVDVEKSSRTAGSYSTTPELFLDKQLVFLQQLTRGSKSLYINGNTAYNQYYIKNDGNFDLLIYKKYLKDVKVNGLTQTVLHENKKYQGQLTVYLSDCADINKLVSRTKYQTKSLQQLFSKYYLCMNEEDQVLRPKRNFKAVLGIGIGVSRTTLDYSYDYGTNKEADKVTQIPIFISAELTKPITIPHWSFFNDLGFSRMGPYEILREFTENGLNYKEISEFRLNSMKLDNLVRYYFSLNKWSIFGEGGLSNLIYPGSKAITLQTTVLGTDVETKRTMHIAKWSHRPLIGAGVMINNFSFDIRYSTPIKLKFTGPYVSFTLGYRFNTKE